jgi:23S rRNA pseudouridine2604 synthase
MLHPLPTEASGLVVYTQDKRIARKLAKTLSRWSRNASSRWRARSPNGLQRLCHGLSFNGRPLPPSR